MLNRIEPSRRTFLVGLGRFAVAAELTAGLPALAFAADGCPPPSAWSDLAKALSGPVLLPDDPFFSDVCRPNNLRYDIRPAGIARCMTAADVQACIGWVKKQGMPFAVRSGGHNYAGFSTTPGLLIDMSLMAGVTPVKGSDGLVTIAGGTLNSLAYKQMERLGRTITHGRCDAVGAAGFLLGGGIGFDMRRFGIGSDLLRSTQLVTADAELVTANDDMQQDLFWACRGGGGGNFGINTSFTLQTYPVDTVTTFNLTWTRDLEKVLHLLLTELAAAPDEFGSKISVTIPSVEEKCQGVGTTISILGQLHKSSTKLRDLFPSTWDLVDWEKSQVQEDVPYWTAQDFLSESTYPYFYQEKSSYMRAANLSRDVVASMFQWAAAMPSTSMPSAFKFFQVGGAIDRTPAGATAYVHRGSDWLFSVEANWWRPTDSQTRVDEALAWQRAFYADVNKRAKAVGAYQNFSDPSLEDWQQAYYGQNYAKLAEVKTAYDPGQLFNFKQAIRAV